jgi:hypothetical protein
MFHFAVYVQLLLIFTLLLLFVVYHDMFQPNWPSSDVQVVVLKECAVLLFFCNYLLAMLPCTDIVTAQCQLRKTARENYNRKAGQHIPSAHNLCT